MTARPARETDNYPADCLVDDCLIYLTGRVEKQTAGVEIDLAQSITVRHCSIYDMPRAGINIGDGCWGGHVIEFCDIFDTVKETGDHGSFNSWGRDRYWLPDINAVNAWVKQVPESAEARCGQTQHSARTIAGAATTAGTLTWMTALHITSSRTIFACTAASRTAKASGVLLKTTSWWTAASTRTSGLPTAATSSCTTLSGPPTVPPICTARRGAQEMDYNLMQKDGATTNAPATQLQRQSGRDTNSIVADAQFIDPAHGDYRVKDGSPALALGFVNFPMDQFGVQKPELKAIARTPLLPLPKVVAAAPAARDTTPRIWLGVSVRNIADEGEMSAFGLPGVTGVLVLEIPADSSSAKAGLQKNDVILSVNGDKTADVTTFDPAGSGFDGRANHQDRNLAQPEGKRSHAHAMKSFARRFCCVARTKLK